jgi:hypothetical protein
VTAARFCLCVITKYSVRHRISNGLLVSLPPFYIANNTHQRRACSLYSAGQARQPVAAASFKKKNKKKKAETEHETGRAK